MLLAVRLFDWENLQDRIWDKRYDKGKRDERKGWILMKAMMFYLNSQI